MKFQKIDCLASREHKCPFRKSAADRPIANSTQDNGRQFPALGSRETLDRLKAMASQYATKDAAERKARPILRPLTGTKLIREWQGIEHCVTVRADEFEYLGRPYKSLSSVAHEITGTKWNGWVFFGLKNHQSRT